jgi:hypothetical protein
VLATWLDCLCQVDRIVWSPPGRWHTEHEKRDADVSGGTAPLAAGPLYLMTSVTTWGGQLPTVSIPIE